MSGKEGLSLWICSNCKRDNNAIACCEFCFYPKNHVQKEYNARTGWSCFDCQKINDHMTYYCTDCFMPQYSPLPPSIKAEPDLDDERRLILIGKTGSGKSATGNSILNKDIFESKISNSSVTRKCQRSTTCLYGKCVQIVDTPGLFDTGMDNEQVTMEILKCVGISAPGPHAFLLTIAIGRFTKEEISTVDLLCNIFGHEMKKHLILIFTKKDVLHKGKKTIEDLIANAPPYLQTLITECENRYIAWNNYANKEEKTQQTKNLFDVIETLLAQNGSSFYRSEIFEETDNIVIEREREIRDIYEHDYLRRLKQYRRQISQEYQQKLKPYLDRDNDLSTQICSLQEKQEQATKDVQKHLGKLSTEIDMLNDTKKGIDNRSSSQVQHLTDMINTSQSKLVENRRLQANLYDEHKTESLNMEREWNSIYREFQPRDEVRKEIEKGNEKILVRFWGNLKRCGQRITDGFIVIFKFFKTKPKTF